MKYVVEQVLPHTLKDADQMSTWNSHLRILNDVEADPGASEAAADFLREKSQEVATFLITDDLFIFKERPKLHAHVSSASHLVYN